MDIYSPTANQPEFKKCIQKLFFFKYLVKISTWNMSAIFIGNCINKVAGRQCRTDIKQLSNLILSFSIQKNSH